LHDGAQQRLVALRIRLELAAEAVAAGSAEPVALLRELGVEAEVALEEVRSLAHGLYPAPLADLGLAGALQAVALCGPVPTTVIAEAGRRYPRDVETAAYFCCLEAMQNAAKHASGATVIRVMLSEGEGALGLEVRDDGPGFDPERSRRGTGLTNMRDRVAAVGGELEVRSAPGTGTRVLAVIPLLEFVARVSGEDESEPVPVEDRLSASPGAAAATSCGRSASSCTARRRA
jgi:signal transduction histidine kinase